MGNKKGLFHRYMYESGTCNIAENNRNKIENNQMDGLDILLNAKLKTAHIL